MRKLWVAQQLQRPSAKAATAFHSPLTVDNYASSGWLTFVWQCCAGCAYRTGRHRKMCRIVTAAARAPMGKCHRSPRAEYSDISQLLWAWQAELRRRRTKEIFESPLFLCLALLPSKPGLKGNVRFSGMRRCSVQVCQQRPNSRDETNALLSLATLVMLWC